MSLNKKSITVKRILSDIKEIKSTYNPKIFICFDENNIKQIKALIIGPDDTPYEDGFFFFTIDIPDKYPFLHPGAKFETINGKIRFNPNLYEKGKVCLSIIGTWPGPKWSSVQTLNSLLISIQSLLDEYPILNEPNFENTKKNDPKSVEYNEYIRFNTYEFAILGMLEKEDHFSIFKNVIEKYFVENYDKIIEKLKSYQHLDGKVMKTFIWGHSVKINYKDLIIKFNKLYDKLSKKDFSLVENTSVILK
jgi:ubiquitin-protein ligase